MGTAQHFNAGTPSNRARAPQQFKVDNRAWGQNKNLDLVAAGDAYLVWHDRALGHLSRERPDVRKLLIWAEGQTEEMLAANAGAMAEQLGVPDAELVDNLLFEGLSTSSTTRCSRAPAPATAAALSCGGACIPSGKAAPRS
jgi:hypothetical protein